MSINSNEVDARASEWKTYDDFAHGIDTYRYPKADLAGEVITLEGAEGGDYSLTFIEGARVSWSGPASAGVLREDPVDVVNIREDVLFINIPLEGDLGKSVTIMLSRATNQGIVTVSEIAPEPVPGVPQVSQTFSAVRIAGATPVGETPVPSRDLIGVRNLYRYSPSHLYEHVYISSERYAWQCVEGAQRGHGDMDMSTIWKLDTDLYLFCFREFRIPVASVWLHDFGAAKQTTGIFLGLSAEGKPTHQEAGGRVIEMAKSVYPDVQPV